MYGFLKKNMNFYLYIPTGGNRYILWKSCFVFHENTSLVNVDYNRNTAALFFFLRIT